jgi:hypothetical protein
MSIIKHTLRITTVSFAYESMGKKEICSLVWFCTAPRAVDSLTRECATDSS